VHTFIFTFELHVLLFTFLSINTEKEYCYKSVECEFPNCNTVLKENMLLINTLISFKVGFCIKNANSFLKNYVKSIVTCSFLFHRQGGEIIIITIIKDTIYVMICPKGLHEHVT